jgi:inorganic pyrophosphatase
MTHTWHDLPFTREDNLENPETLNCVIEIPEKTKAKYEIDKETGMLMLDRVLSSPMHYPYNYGFIPQTLCDDGDALDAIVFTQVTLQPLCMLNIKPIGVMHMIDGGEADDKILAVASDDPHYRHINDISELPTHILNEIETFFSDYKKLEKKSVQISGFKDSKTARKIVQQSIVDYKAKFKK